MHGPSPSEDSDPSTAEKPASKLTLPVLGAYSGLAIPVAALGLPIGVYLPPFYASEVGLGLGLVGTIFMLARIWDVFTDPVMGYVVDRYPSRWGRRRHWIVMAVPILMVSAWFVFMPSEGEHSWFYLFGWMVLLYVGFTFLAIAHQSWGVDLTSEYNERSRLYGWREIALIAGMVTVLVLPVLIEQTSEPGAAVEYAKVASMGWYLIILLPITALICVLVVPDHADGKPIHMDFREIWHMLRDNVPLRRVLAAEFLTAMGVAATAATYLFLARYVFELPTYASLILLGYFVVGLLGTGVWVQLAYRIGKHNSLIIGMLYGSVTLFIYFMLAEPGALVSLIIATLLYGVQFGTGPVVIRAMLADVADLHELTSGNSRAGLMFALMTTTGKLAAASAVGVTYWLLEMFGFDPSVDPLETSQAAKDAVLYVFMGVPIVCFALAALCVWRYPLDEKRHNEVAAALAARRAAAAGE